MALIRPEEGADIPSWRDLWAVEMRDRKWLWQANAGLILWAAISWTGLIR